jgi:hypothetical protein
MNKLCRIYLIIYLLFASDFEGQVDTLFNKSRVAKKSSAFGFNLDWHLGYNYTKSGASLEFLTDKLI